METETIILTPPFSPSFRQYERSIRFDALDDAQDDAHRLFDEASARLRPTVMIRRMFIDSHDTVDGLPSVAMAGIRFAGKALAVLSDVHRVFAYIATCGDGMETFDLNSYDMLAPYWLDTMKNQALGSARRAMLAYCKNSLGISKPLSLNPGSGNTDIWPIEQLHGIFSLLGGGDTIGVRLTESSLMVPNKSISGLLFASATADYESCAYCERENCPNRRVPFVRRL